MDPTAKPDYDERLLASCSKSVAGLNRFLYALKPAMTSYPVTVRFDEADARGVLFYGRILTLAHRVFEQFVVARVVPRWEDWFLAESFLVPIRHAEADYFAPMRPGRRYDAKVLVSRLGSSSFEVTTRFSEEATAEPVLCAETRVTHVFADPVGFRKLGIPPEIRARLEALKET